MAGHLVQRAHGGRRRNGVSARVQARPRRHRVKAEGFPLSFWPLAGLAQNEELGCTGCETGRRGRMGQKKMTISKKKRRSATMAASPKDRTIKSREAISANMFQQLYDSEINFEVSCFWDAGFRCSAW